MTTTQNTPTLQQSTTELVKEWVTANNKTQQDLARILNISQPAVCRKINGKLLWTLADIEALNNNGVFRPQFVIRRVK